MRQANCFYIFYEKIFDIMRRLNLDQLHAVVEVVRLGSFSAAARRLNLTQPAVSLQVRELEERLGVPLVERLGKRAYATAAGSELIERAQRIEREVDDALDAMRRRREGGLARVRIGTGAAILAYLLPPVLRVLRRKYPNVEIVVTTGTTDAISAQVARNELDLGLVTLPVAERSLTVVPVREDPMLAVLPPTEQHAPRTLDAAALARYPLILDPAGAQMHEIARDWFRAAGIEPRSAMELGHIAIRHIISAGLGASILPIEAVLGDVASAPVVLRGLEPPLTRSLATICRSDKRHDVALAQVQEALLAIRDRKIALRRGDFSNESPDARSTQRR
jgi:DNA-binding transcriptional LysR family regulator